MPDWLPDWLDLDVDDVVLVATAALLVAVSGLMSGLTLGLMSLDRVDMEVLRRTGERPACPPPLAPASHTL